ncbi:unnamed protein product [[Candida] boidinii]|uniref:DNA ligase 4 n=1 Tax=Candida boidinii TaxID=5477 RepID=A0A9W6SYA7_CANBO|nr:hypothetical protein B5S30_g5054 [[Candida] boidinii]GME67365.1 unnamed protein product [[Candida] boidinii]GMF98665.1 unnamed protein product [[Candida] boidinii]
MNDSEPEQPRNHAPLPLFKYLVQELFLPLERISNDSSIRLPTTEKAKIIDTFMKHWRQYVGNDIYPAIVLILPQKDKFRLNYSIKETTLIRICSKIIHLSKNSSDYKSLQKWKHLSYNQMRSRVAFADLLAKIVSTKYIVDPMLKDSKIGISIEEINDTLNKLASVYSKSSQDLIDLISPILKKLNYDELRFFFRIVLKTSPVFRMERYIFNSWHPDAAKLYDLTNDLKYVFWGLATKKPSERLSINEISVQIMKPFTPQRSMRTRISYDKIVENFNGDFYIEEKFDGERFQLHMKREDDDTISYKFYTRNANDFTLLYGESSESPGCLSPFISNAFHEKIKSCILDGEMISYDPVRKKALPFSTVKTSALQEFYKQKDNILQTSESYPMFCVFDILLCNGISVEKQPLSERKKLLDKVLYQPVPTRLEKSSFKKCSTKEDIENNLGDAIKADSEGIMIKSPRGKYIVGSTSDSWVKVKPEYLEEFGENIDLIIVGKIPAVKSSYLCALRYDPNQNSDANLADDDDEEDGAEDEEMEDKEEGHGVDDNATDELKETQNLQTNETDNDNNASGNIFNCTFYTLCKVANGFSEQDYKQIESLTKGKWHESSKRLPSEEIIKFGKLIPDKWIDPRDSVVLEIKARSADNGNYTENYATATTLCNAYCGKIRNDKDWKTCSTVQEFVEKTNNGKHTATQTVIGNKRSKTRVRSKKKEIEKFMNKSVEIDVSSNIFSKFVIFPLSDTYNKDKKLYIDDVSVMIKQNGGEVIRNLRNIDEYKGKRVLLLSDKMTRTVVNFFNQGYSIFKFEWLFDSIQMKFPVPLEPRHCLKVCDELSKYSLQNVSKFGNSFAVPFDSADKLYDFFKSMNLQSVTVSDTDIASDQYSETSKLYLMSLFSNIKFLLIESNRYRLEMIGIRDRILLYGGEITTNLEEASFVVSAEVEEMVVADKISQIKETLAEYVKKSVAIPRIVTTAFIDDSIKEGVLVDAKYYLPHPWSTDLNKQ